MVHIQTKRDNAVNWALNNPVLMEGEIGYDTTNRLYKIGDGTTAWEDLSEFNPGSLFYMGTWDASSGVYPSLPDKGWYFVCSVSGSVGVVNYGVGDWIVWNGIAWDKINNQTSTSSSTVLNTTTKTSNYTTTESDNVVLCNSTGGSFTITLGYGVTGTTIMVKKRDDSPNVVTVHSIVGLIDGDSYDYILNCAYEFVQLQYDGTGWWITAE